MKKIFIYLTATLVLVSSILLPNENIVKARVEYSLYPFSCSNYEVSHVTDDGSFSLVGCYDRLNDAVQRMYSLGEDAVVRHINSFSPTKIIAMNSGVVYSYPTRSQSVTINIYQNENNSGKRTYVTMHREMAYFGLYSYNEQGSGKIKVNLNGFDGYADLQNVDLIPIKFIKREIPIYLGGNDTLKNEQPFATRIYQGHYDVVQNGNYKDLVYVAHSGWSNNGWPARYTFVVGPAANWMNVGDVYYSYNGYDLYRDREYRQKINTYYSYYNYLPFRTKTKIKSSTFNQLLERVGKSSNSKLMNIGNELLNYQEQYGMNAALVFAMACLESAYGTSRFALERNNLFGWKAYDSNVNAASYFNSPADGIREHMGINLRGYLDINDYRFFGMHLGNKGSGLNVNYASDPYWGYKIAAIAYELDKTDNNFNGQLTDFNQYSLGMINTYDVPFYRYDAGGDILYKSGYGNSYQLNFIVPILNVGNRVKVQSTNGINDSNNLIQHTINRQIQPIQNYNWDRSVAYIDSRYITPLNFDKLDTTIGKVKTGDFVLTVDRMEIKEGTLSITGKSYMPGIFVNEDNKVQVKLAMQDIYLDESKHHEYELITSIANNDQITYKVDIPLKDIVDGEYFFTLYVNYSRYSENNQAVELSDKLYDVFKTEDSTRTYELLKQFNSLALKLTTKQVETKEEEKPKEPEKETNPTIVPVVSSDYMIEKLESFAYTDESKNKVALSGIAFINNVDFKETDNVTHTIVLMNMLNNERLEFPMESYNIDSEIKLSNDKVYKKIKYRGEIDLSTIPQGEYKVLMRVTSNGVSKERLIYTYDASLVLPDTTVNNQIISFDENQLYSYRYEISVNHFKLDTSKVNKPNRRNSFVYIDNMKFENDALVLDLVSWMYGVNYTQNSNPTYKVGVISLKDNTYQSFDFETKACPQDYGKLFNATETRLYSCASGKIDLKDFSSGDYALYVENTVGNYYDIFELYDFTNRQKPSIDKYQLSVSGIRDRVQLTVK